MSRLDRVRVATFQGDVEISWHERELLLVGLLKQTGSADTIRAFVAVGTSAPVELDKRSRLLVIVALNALERASGELPPRLLELRKTLLLER